MVGLAGWLLLGGRSSLGGILLFSSLAFASHSSFDPSLSSSPSSSTSTLHLSSETPTGAIVKRFPRLPSLSLLPSKDSDTFYLLPTGELMLARPLTCSAGSNLSLAVMHEVEEGGPATIHLLQLHVHGKGDYLEFEQAQYVMGVEENKPAGTVVGSTRSVVFIVQPLMHFFSHSCVTTYFPAQVGWWAREQSGSEFAPGGQVAGEVGGSDELRQRQRHCRHCDAQEA